MIHVAMAKARWAFDIDGEMKRWTHLAVCPIKFEYA